MPVVPCHLSPNFPRGGDPDEDAGQEAHCNDQDKSQPVALCLVENESRDPRAEAASKPQCPLDNPVD